MAAVDAQTPSFIPPEERISGGSSSSSSFTGGTVNIPTVGNNTPRLRGETTTGAPTSKFTGVDGSSDFTGNDPNQTDQSAYTPMPGVNTGASAYTPSTGRRDTRLGIDAGSPAFVLDDPDGDAWVMKSVSLITHPEQTYEGLTGLGDRLNLPPGWTFRAIVLDTDVVLTPDNGTARITQDDLGNVYDRAGGPFSNYRP